jgi:serine/threonine protein phosphatase PrpC/MFS family permease
MSDSNEQRATTPPPVERQTSTAWLNRTVLGIGLASLFSDVGHEMATAAMPALLASIGSTSLFLGLIEGVSDGVSSLAKLYSGLYSDRLRRRKPLAVVGYFLTAAGMASFSLATRGWHVLLGRLGGWLGRGARTPVRNVLLTEATTPENYGRAFGLERAMDSAGAVVGPLLALVFLSRLGLRAVFLWTIVPGAVAAVLIGALVRERAHPPQQGARLLSGLAALPTSFRRFLLGVGIAGLGDFSNTFLILWATQAWTARFGATRAAALAIAFYTGYNVVYTISCWVSGALADRMSKRRLLAAGYALAVIPAFALVFPGASLIKFGVAFAFSGLYMGVWETVESATAATYLPHRLRGLGFGALATVNGVGDVLSSIAVGALWTLSPLAAMSLVAVASIAGALVIGTARSGPTFGDKEKKMDQGELPRGLSVYGATDVGKVRDSNEDTYVISQLETGVPASQTKVSFLSVEPPGVLLMVCDGMGGAAAGEVAARLACETVCRTLHEQRTSGTNPDLAAAMLSANRAIFEEARRHSEERGMGTTSTAALVHGGRLTVAQVGDSRAYLYRGGALQRLTRDQSLAMAMVDSGTLSPAELKDFPHGNIILQALGVQERVAPVITELELEPWDTILLCTDGLHGFVDEDKIAAVLSATPHLPEGAAGLIQAALDAGAPDNVTVILAQWSP